MRKWFLPQFSNLFLIVREPIVLYVLYLNFKYNICCDKIIKVLFVFSFISFFLTLLFGHHNIIVAIYGVRVTLIHLPCIFIFSKVITRDDIHLIGKTILYVSVIMFIIIIMQYFSPATALVNIGTGGQGTASFYGVAGYMRPSGTFSFISGLVQFEFLLGVYIFFYLYNNNRLNSKYKLSKVALAIFVVIFLFSITLCLSRTIIFQILLLFVAMIIYQFFNGENIKRIIYLVVFITISFYLLSYIDSFKLAFDNILERFDNASKIEGDVVEGTLGSRYLGSFYRAFFETQNFSNQEIPMFGFGLGIGTKVGEKILDLRSVGHSFAFAEEEWSRIVCEIGLLQGVFFLLIIRFIYPVYLVIKAIKHIKKSNDMFLYFSIFPFLYYIINGQWSVPSTLGFTVIISTLFMSALNQNEYCYYVQNIDHRIVLK